MSRSPRRLSGLPLYLIGVLALVLAMGGAATAGALVTSKQIKDNTITTKDIRNGSLLVKDVKKSQVLKLRGKDGTDGTDGSNGADGASAFAPPPSGTLITGGNVVYLRAGAPAEPQRSYNPLPFTMATDLVDSGVGQNLWAGAGPLFQPVDVNTTACPGTYDAPTATAGNLCVYSSGININVTPGIADLFAGISVNTAGRKTGFLLSFFATASGLVNFRYTWAYRAP